MECLHCGEREGRYCEGCYQELISINIKLQSDNKRLKKEAIKYNKEAQYYHDRLMDILFGEDDVEK